MIRALQGRKISLLVPRTPGLDEGRDRVWAWLEQYWQHHLPRAEIIIGRDPGHFSRIGRTFSKTTAVNDAASRAKGDIFVLLDSDAYVAPDIITYAASEIRRARKRHRRLWFIPYRRFYRLSRVATNLILRTDHRLPQMMDDPPSPLHLDINGNARAPGMGHHYAAMIMIYPREAFEEVGGMDERFIGWGGEDISFMRAMDTIYNTHKTMNRSVYHMYHPTIGSGIERQWIGQMKTKPFTLLGARYQAAYGDRERMLRLNNEWRQGMTKVHPDIAEDSKLNSLVDLPDDDDEVIEEIQSS